MHKTKTGFTIVELLIVIVVVAILATISVVAYNGIQQRARDITRTQAIAQIQKALEVYLVEYGRYPAHIGVGTNKPAGFSGTWGDGFSHSVDTAGNWMKNLKNTGIVGDLPVDPINNNSYYFTYYASPAAGYGACKEPFYVLAVRYESIANIPAHSRSLSCTGEGVNFTTSTDGNRAVFSNIKTPGI
ncbi:MAG TPA: prepilin-type N-terminal cleavage/methylation domain-containing protein [Candidatus Nanoperiomorbaceae bacterium]|nr:prepilin-type N-terminal cleavage/methylation domain-containing protein [Candidatus Nanoperiomorbaceae bacterium]